MNTLPIKISSCNSYGSCCSVRKVNQTPSFSGLKSGGKIPQKANNLVKKAYQALFLDSESRICGTKDGYVYTQRNMNDTVISQKIKMWHHKPEAIIKDNRSTSLREKTVLNKNGTHDVEVQDVYTEGYKISAGYSGVKNGLDSGTVKINYGDTEIEIAKEERESLCKGFSDLLNKKFPKTAEEMRAMNDKEFNAYMSEYRLTPETTATAILVSPQALEEQLDVVPRALPYGIECILEKLGK